MLTPQPHPTQTPPKAKRVQPNVPETDPSNASDPPDILTIIRDDLAFLERINQILSAKTRAGDTRQRDPALHI